MMQLYSFGFLVPYLPIQSDMVEKLLVGKGNRPFQLGQEAINGLFGSAPALRKANTITYVAFSITIPSISLIAIRRRKL